MFRTSRSVIDADVAEQVVVQALPELAAKVDELLAAGEDEDGEW